MKKLFSIMAVAVLAVSILSGCGQKAAPTPAPTPAPTTTTQTPAKADAVTAASVVDNGAVLAKSISKDGKWLVGLSKDVTTDQELALDGTFKNEKGATQRRLCLFTEDAKYVITARFTLTAPKITVTSPEASIENGTFKGDIYVSAKDFKLIATKVEGNVYFTTDEAKSTFNMDAKSSVTGVQQLKK
jgi:hypothetical protein